MDDFLRRIRDALESLETRHPQPELSQSNIYLHRLKPDSPLALALVWIDREQWFGFLHLDPKTRAASLDYQKLKFTTIEDALIESDAGTETLERCTLLTMPSTLRESFIQISSELAGLHDRQASDEHLYRVIEAWSEAFLQDIEPTDGEILGLWGELVVIADAADPDAFVRAWHVEKTATYDFVFGSGRVLEVKTAGNGKRKHSFSSNQVHDAMPTDFQLVSLVTLPSSDGVSASQLKNEILLKLGSIEAQVSFLRKCSKVCPPQSRKMNLAWNLQSARDSMMTYGKSDLRVPKYDFPISDVNWSQIFDLN